MNGILAKKLGRDLTRADAYLREQYLFYKFEKLRTRIDELAARKWSGWTETFLVPDFIQEQRIVSYENSMSFERKSQLARRALSTFGTGKKEFLEI